MNVARTRYGARFWDVNAPYAYAGVPAGVYELPGSPPIRPGVPIGYGPRPVYGIPGTAIVGRPAYAGSVSDGGYASYGNPYGVWPFTTKAGSSDEPKFIGKAANTLLDVGSVVAGTALTLASAAMTPIFPPAALGVAAGVALATIPIRRGKAKRDRRAAGGVSTGGQDLVTQVYDEKAVANAMKVASMNDRMASRQAGTSTSFSYAPPAQYSQPGPEAMQMMTTGGVPLDQGPQLAVPLIIGGVILAGIAAWVFTQKKR